MKIVIENDKKLALIQAEFTQIFPFLHLEVYCGDTDFTRPSSKKIKPNSQKTLGECSKEVKQGIITLFPEMSVADLEDIFRYSFGMSVQVLRKSGSVWLETNHTDKWSLQEQNRQGELVSLHLSRQEEKRKSL